MDMHATLRSQDMRTPQSQGWRFIVPAIALLILVHQILVGTPLHASMSPTAPASGETSSIDVCNQTCPSTIAHVSDADRVRIMVQAVFSRPLFMALMILALLILTTIASRVHSFLASPYGALWPPQRRRALLQIFLI